MQINDNCFGSNYRRMVYNLNTVNKEIMKKGKKIYLPPLSNNEIHQALEVLRCAV